MTPASSWYPVPILASMLRRTIFACRMRLRTHSLKRLCNALDRCFGFKLRIRGGPCVSADLRARQKQKAVPTYVGTAFLSETQAAINGPGALLLLLTHAFKRRTPSKLRASFARPRRRYRCGRWLAAQTTWPEP